MVRREFEMDTSTDDAANIGAMTELILRRSPDDLVLLEKRAALVEARARLADRESELTQIRAQLKAFEGRYLRQVGALYAELDDLEALITEREVDLYDSDAARERAEEARRRAQESHEAAFGTQTEARESDPPPNLKALFRELAKRIHPDFARDEVEQEYFHRLMARANQAYSRGQLDILERLLDDQLEIHSVLTGDSAEAELLRVTRQIEHAEREVAHLEAERYALDASEIAQLFADSEAAATEHRDLLTELATTVREQIVEARARFERVNHQVKAHGR